MESLHIRDIVLNLGRLQLPSDRLFLKVGDIQGIRLPLPETQLFSGRSQNAVKYSPVQDLSHCEIQDVSPQLPVTTAVS